MNGIHLKKNEKIMLIVLGLFALYGLFYFFFVSPMEKHIAEMDSQYEMSKVEKEAKQVKIDRIPQVQSEIKKYEDMEDYSDDFFEGAYVQEEAIRLIQSYIDECGLKLNKVVYSGGLINLVEELPPDENAPIVPTDGVPPAPALPTKYLDVISIKISVSTDETNAKGLLDFIGKIDKTQKMLVCNEITINVDNPLKISAIYGNVENSPKVSCDIKLYLVKLVLPVEENEA